MVHPASDKVNALSVVAAEAMEQGSLVKFVANGSGGVMSAFKVTATADLDNFGAYMAYHITPDSEDVEFTGNPESTTFTLNTDTGVGGGTQTIASGSEMVALGGAPIALVRVDLNSLYNTARTISSFPVATKLKIEATNAFLALDADDDINRVAGLVVANDGVTIVVQLAV